MVKQMVVIFVLRLEELQIQQVPVQQCSSPPNAMSESELLRHLRNLKLKVLNLGAGYVDVIKRREKVQLLEHRVDNVGNRLLLET